MKTYFIRHSGSLDISETTLNELIEKNLIAVHYPYSTSEKEATDCTSTNPDDYKIPKANSALKIFNNLSREGGYVCAEYRNRDGAVVGTIAPDTQIKLLEGRNNTDKNRKAILKTLHLVKFRHIETEDYLKISFARPTQGTICIWKKAGNRVEHMVNQTPLEQILDNLSPAHQEVLCSEFLRSGIDPHLPKIQSFILPVGRTLKDIDIFGITESGQKVYCQVTHDSRQHADKKMEKLKPYESSDGYTVLFCMNTQDYTPSSNRVFIYSMQTVFERFTKTSEGKLWLKTVFE